MASYARIIKSLNLPTTRKKFPMTPTELLCQLVSIPSVNPMGREVSGDIFFEHRLSDWLMDYFRSIGAACERIEVAPGRANVLARYDAPNAKTTLLFDAHQDTVPIDGMTISPFLAEVRDGRVWGRGASDVKGGMAAMLHAFTRLVEEKPANSANIVFSCTCDEESTTIGIQDLVTYWSTGRGKSLLLTTPPDGAVVAEPTELDIVVAHRGVTRFRVHAHGRACHSSDPTQGRSAIYAMAKIVNFLEDYASKVPETVSPHALCGRPSLSVGRIAGGISVNVVPDHCVIEIDRRLVPGEDPALAWKWISDEVMQQFGPHVTVDPAWISSPALSDHDNAWLASLVAHCANSVDPNNKHTAIGVPYCTHASTTSCAGVPSIVFGPGSITQAHTEDEFIEIEQLNLAAEIYFQVMLTTDLLRSQ
jgi:succinyl-diaminopimelate desuccinylase